MMEIKKIENCDYVMLPRLLSKLLGVFEHRGGKRLQEDGTNQKQPFFHKLKFT